MLATAVEFDPLGLVLQLGLLLVLLALSGLFSGSEAVLFSLTPHQLEQCRQSSNPLRRLAATVLTHPKRTLLNILLGNNAVNVLLYASVYIATSRLEPLLGWLVTPLGAVFSVLFVLIGGDVIPKVLAVTMTERLTPLAAAVVHGLGLTVGWLARLLDLLIVEPLTRLLFGRTSAQAVGAHAITTQELKTLLEMNRRRGLLHPTEDELLREVIDLRQLRVADVMIPRVEVLAFDLDGSPDDLRALMQRTRRTKIPVYSGTIDNIVGFIHAKVLFLAAPDVPLRKLERSPARYVPEIINCEQLLFHFRETRSQIAIAVDEFGGMAGLVGLEDVLEELIGDVFEPHEPPREPEIIPLAENEYDISARLGLHYWAETFGLPALASRVVTVGGLVTAQLGRPARLGESLTLGNVTLTVRRLRGRRIERLHLRIAPSGSPATWPTAVPGPAPEAAR